MPDRRPLPLPLRAVVAAAGCLVLLLAGCTGSDQADGEQLVGTNVTLVAADHRAPAPQISGPALTGSARLDVSDHRGDVVVINFWGSWCGPCDHEAPELKRLADELAGRGVSFLGVDVRDQPVAAQRFQERHGISYPSIFDKPAATVLAFDGKVPANPPSTVVLDRRGRVAARVIGETSAATLRPIILDVLAEPSS